MGGVFGWGVCAWIDLVLFSFLAIAGVDGGRDGIADTEDIEDGGEKGEW